MADQRRFDSIERVVRDERRRADDFRATVLARLATHTHAGGGGGGGAVDSVNGKTGAVVLDAAAVDAQPADLDLTTIAGLTPTDGALLARVAGAWAAFDPASLPVSTATQTALDGKENTGTAASAVATHAGGSDPHPQYLPEAGGTITGDLNVDGNVDVGGSVELAAGTTFAIGEPSGASFSIRSPTAESPTMFTSILEGETAVRWRVRPNGLMQWGSGATGPDVTLARTDVGEMTLSASLDVEGDVSPTGNLYLQEGQQVNYGGDSGTAPFAFKTPNATDPIMATHVGEDLPVRYRLYANGWQRWGGGASAPDVSLERTDAGELTVDGNLVVSGRLAVQGIGQVNIIAVTADTTVNNSTTLVDVAGLAVPVVSGAFYAVTSYVPYTASTAGDLKIGWSAPGGSIMRWGIQGLRSDGSNTSGGPEEDGSTGAPLAVGGTNKEAVCSPIGVFIAGATGTLQMQMAQNSAHASDASIHLGAWLRVERIS